MNYISNAYAIILILSTGERVRVEKSDKIYPKILKVFSLPENEQEDAVREVLTPTEVSLIKALEQEEAFEVKGDDLYFEGDKLPVALSTKINSIVRDGLPIKHFVQFWKRLRMNPSSVAVSEGLDFLSYRELPITEDGCFVAYKGVDGGGWSLHGNKATKVLQGEVNAGGYIRNPIGAVVEVLRRDVDDDRSNECSHGLHVGSMDYALGWGCKTVVVKVDPVDVVSVPKDCQFQKCRVCKYEVLSEFVSEITVSVVDEDGENTLTENEQAEREEFIDKVENYLLVKADDGCDEVTVRQIQNAFSPVWPPKENVVDALQELMYGWEDRGGVLYVQL